MKLIALLIPMLGIALSSSPTFANQNLAQVETILGVHLDAELCHALLFKSGVTKLESKLRLPGTSAKDAIGLIAGFLSTREGNGVQKYEEWKRLISYYNSKSREMIIAPSLQTRELDFVVWGGTRGNLLIFRPDGAIFKSYNPNRENPMNIGPRGYQIDWADPTLREVRESSEHENQ